MPGALAPGILFCLMEETLWGPMGAEADAAYTVDRAGTALGDGGLNATLRDYARFGLLMIQDGWREGVETDVDAVNARFAQLFGKRGEADGVG